MPSVGRSRNYHPTRNLHPIVVGIRRRITTLVPIYHEYKYRVVGVTRIALAAYPGGCLDSVDSSWQRDSLRDNKEHGCSVALNGTREIVRAAVATSCANARVVDRAIVVDFPR